MIAGCIAIVVFILTFSVMLDCIANCFRSRDVNEPTTTKYWKNMNMYDEYVEEILRLIDIEEDKKREIIYLQSSLRKSTLRNRNQNTNYATEEDIQEANKELYKLEKTIAELYKCRDHYYWRTKDITREMNRRGMWELSTN